jgi:hypothetical protein
MQKGLILNRRRVLLSGAAALGCCSAPAPASSLTGELRRVGRLLSMAISAELDAQNTPLYPAACAEAERLQSTFDDLADRVWAAPARTWDDVVARAEIAAHYHGGSTPVGYEALMAGKIEWAEAYSDRSACELLVAVLRMGRRE